MIAPAEDSRLLVVGVPQSGLDLVRDAIAAIGVTVMVDDNDGGRDLTDQFLRALEQAEMCILVWRDPTEVAPALIERYSVSADEAFAWWMHFIVAVLHHHHNVVLVDPHQIAEHPETLGGLADALELTMSDSDIAAVREAASVHAMSDVSHGPDTPVGDAAVDLYHTLSTSGIPEREAINRWWGHAAAAAVLFRQPPEAMAQELLDARHRITDLELTVRETSELRAELDDASSQLDRTIKAVRAQSQARQDLAIEKRRAELQIEDDRQRLLDWEASYNDARSRWPVRAVLRASRLAGRPPPRDPPPALHRVDDSLVIVEELVAAGLIDEHWYRRTNSDVATARVDPIAHYMEHGWKERRLPNEFFDSGWYLDTYDDIAQTGTNPLVHYFLNGAFEHRDPGPLFDTEWYLRTNLDVVAAGQNPLSHFLLYGRDEGRRPKSDGRRRRGVVRVTEDVPWGQNDETIAQLADTHAANSRVIDATTVSIVMPTYNRANSIEPAIQSVMAQTHTNWQLLIVDDGSTDETVDIIDKYLADPRIELIKGDHQGVSAARNRGLDAATGDVIAYLDSDNQWLNHHLRSILAYRVSHSVDCCYSGMVILDDDEQVTAYRGDVFDWSQCLASNYVDLNVFVHENNRVKNWRFDERLRRMVDWDYILRVTRDVAVGYAPYAGCYYFDSDDADRISQSEARAFAKVVRARNELGADAELDETVSAAVALSIAVLIAAPRSQKNQWGDFHYAEGLVSELRFLGHPARVVFQDDPSPDVDVRIVLRGLTDWKAEPGQINVLWVISHPDKIDLATTATFDLVYVASLSHAALLSATIDKPVAPLLQATDISRFTPDGNTVEVDGEALFVGKSRGAARPIVDWAIAERIKLALYGSDWGGTPAEAQVVADHIPNQELADYYRSAPVVLNDHWESMRDFGIVSNRVFDVLSSGGRLISDRLAALHLLFGSTVRIADNQAELGIAVRTPYTDTERREQAEVTAWVGEDHTMATRAETLVDDVLGTLALPPIHQRPPDSATTGAGAARARFEARKQARRRVGLVVKQGGDGWQSSAFLRLLSPLTTDWAFDHVTVEGMVSSEIDFKKLSSFESIIVQRNAINSAATAEHLIDTARAKGIQLVVDNDDAFRLINPDHPEHDLYRADNAVYEKLLKASDNAIFSTPELRELYADISVNQATIIDNALDPRIWRTYRAGMPQPATDPLRILIMGTATHDADVAMIVPALAEFAARHPIKVTVIGAARKLELQPWLRVTLPPRDKGRYTKFARWMLLQGPYDVGLAPLVDDEFNACKSDVKFLDYLACGLVPVLSSTRAYTRRAAHSGLALMADNTTESWLAALEAARDRSFDPELVAENHEATADYLWNERSITHVTGQLLDVLGVSVEAPQNP